QPEHRALEPHRGELDRDLVEQLLLVEDGHLGGRPAFDELREHRGRGLADRTAAPDEAHLLDRLAVGAEPDRDGHLVTAERVLALGLGVRALERAVVPRMLVVVEDDLPVHLVEFGHPANTCCTLSSDAWSRSISSGTV